MLKKVQFTVESVLSVADSSERDRQAVNKPPIIRQLPTIWKQVFNNRFMSSIQRMYRN